MAAIQRALISVTDKSGIVDFAQGLRGLGVEIISTGGTARAIHDAGVPVREVSELTGFPEMLDGRLKTINPRIAGGILAIRGNTEHMKSLAEHQIGTIDMVVVNLYALRAPRPTALLVHPDPEGPWNPELWTTGLGTDRVGVVVAAWGAYSHPRLPPSRALAEQGRAGWYCLGTNSDGSPRHPLYTRRDEPLSRWTPAAGGPVDANPLAVMR